MQKLKKIINEMDYEKLIPIQLSNIYRELSKLNAYNKSGKVNGVKRSYLNTVKLMKLLKKSIDMLKD